MSKTRPLKPIDGTHHRATTPDPILSAPPLRRMAIGARRGLTATMCFYALTLLGFVITLGHLFDGRSFGVIDVGCMYLAWGLIGGALAGLAFPLARGWLSSIPVAALIFAPLAVAVRIMDMGWTGWRASDAMIILASSLFMALIWGPLVWRQLHAKS